MLLHAGPGIHLKSRGQNYGKRVAQSMAAFNSDNGSPTVRSLRHAIKPIGGNRFPVAPVTSGTGQVPPSL